GQGGGPHVQVFEYNGSYNPAIFPGGGVASLYSFFAYDNFYGGVRVAVGDTPGVGHDEIITGAGPGGGPHVKVFDGQTGALVQSFFAYDPSFTGGVYVAAGNYEGPNVRHADILTGPGFSGGPNVKVFNGQNPAVVLESFMAFPLAVTTVGLG